MRYGSGWGDYVPVGQRKVKAQKLAAKLAEKQQRERQPIHIEGRKIAKSFWGKAWCDHVESLGRISNRLPRGKTYVRNGSVVDLVIKPGQIEAIVAGSSPYKVSISIKKIDKATWAAIKMACSTSIDSLLDLLGGRLSDAVMRRLTNKKSGCFPSAAQINMYCSCPDGAVCCKHVAAVMYGIGSKLDTAPELLFLLRGADQGELISQAVSRENLAQELSTDSNDLDGEDLGAIFGIELDSMPAAKVAAKGTKAKPVAGAKGARKKKAVKKKAVKKKAVKKKAVKKKAVKKKAVKKKAVKKKAVTKKPAAKK